MDAWQRLAVLRRAAESEVDNEPPPPPLEKKPCQTPDSKDAASDSPTDCEFSTPIQYAALPGGKRIPLLKAMLTSACERNCNYCAFRAGRDFSRTSLSPDELAKVSLAMWRKGAVQGVFLSSGVAGGGVRTQDRLLATAEILRHKLNFRDYIHLKIMPGAEFSQVERAMQLADRVSVNLEAPTALRLGKLAPQKKLIEDLLQPLKWVEEIRRRQAPDSAGGKCMSSSTTQFVVGAVDESDLELLQLTEYLYRTLRLSRAYFSAFQPVDDTPFAEHAATNPWRTYRLYQASFLLRDYDFSFEELPFSAGGNLPLERDPKLVWAQENLSQAPLEINRADMRELMRLPGVGKLGAQTIISARRKTGIKSLEDLRALGVRTNRLTPFVLLAGNRPPYQPQLL